MQEDLLPLWHAVEKQFLLGPYSIHGPKHWQQVESNGLSLSAETAGSDQDVIRLFAVFHDSCRETDSYDPEHGQRGAQLAREYFGKYFEASLDQMDLLCIACSNHHLGAMSEDPTIACCYDADRLDLVRVGIGPQSNFMNTETGKLMAAKGIQFDNA